ncbi:hypothetical protein JRQ81_002931 [Phrynocephalus forsythii]|uniref:Uncharacterized protein n=1 Tax=Phrynocephalus forsythii TaxID=171643 RepID=A0A9Q1AWZ7_9SAUR|nr:hypothetical protein JRQ81_002931 [Phrynocephalus forsythii]
MKNYHSVISTPLLSDTIKGDTIKTTRLKKTLVISKTHTFQTENLSKYPDVVVLPEGESGDYMTLRNIQLPGFELMIVWKIHVNEEGKVIPALDLLHKIPISIEKANKFTSNASSWFRSMLHVLGIEASIETLIKSLCKGK